ncbi:MAG TPA: GNAT family N-acetyltransferase [Candidatus Wallbacteria bacterium]|nr:GNAT family N-acetyltransferase [Candidatus Wallbacteria bacterium]
MNTLKNVQLTLISDYKNIEKYRSSFNDLAAEVFGIDFEPWYKAGFWNERYVCFSFADGDRVVSNVSVNMMDLTLAGEFKKAVQIGTVMTHPDYRGRGLSSNLMNIVLSEYDSKCDFIYLFANESAYGFYPGFGFGEARESSFIFEPASFGGDAALNWRKLDIRNGKDLEILKRLAYKRMPVSSKLGVTNDSHLIMFYCLNFYSDDIYYIQQADTALICRAENAALYLYDVLFGNACDTRAVLSAAIKNGGARKAVFMFTPDLFVSGLKGVCEEKDYKLFIRPRGQNFPFDFTFPRLSHA